MHMDSKGASSCGQKPIGLTIPTQTTGLYSLPGLTHLEEYDIIIGESIPREDQYLRRWNLLPRFPMARMIGIEPSIYVKMLRGKRIFALQDRKAFLIDKGPSYAQPQRVGSKPVQTGHPLPAQPTASREAATGPPPAADSGEGPSYGGKVHMVYDEVDDSTLRVVIDNFSKMSDTLCSDPKQITDVPWRIMVMPKQHMVQKKSQKCMGFFLQCCPDNTFSDQVSCHAVAEMRLLSKKQSVQNFVQKTTHVYTAKENDWGYSCFMTWALLEQVSQDVQRANPYIAVPVTIEQSLMEGAYNKVALSEKNIPSPYFVPFFRVMTDAIRAEIAACMSKSFKKVPVTDAVSLLIFKTPAEVVAYAKLRGWTLEANNSIIVLNASMEVDGQAKSALDPTRIAKQTIFYAKQLEMIV